MYIIYLSALSQLTFLFIRTVYMTDANSSQFHNIPAGCLSNQYDISCHRTSAVQATLYFTVRFSIYSCSSLFCKLLWSYFGPMCIFLFVTSLFRQREIRLASLRSKNGSHTGASCGERPIIALRTLLTSFFNSGWVVENLVCGYIVCCWIIMQGFVSGTARRSCSC